MKKNIWNWSILAAWMAIIVLLILQFSKPQKIVYVDTTVLLQKYKGMKDAKVEFESKTKQMKANVDTLMVDWEKELKAYEKDRRGMTVKERELKQELLRNKQIQINQYREAVQQQISEEEQKIMQTVANEINDYVEEYGKKHRYKMIIGATGTGNLLYARKYLNITDDILKGLNEEYK